MRWRLLAGKNQKTEPCDSNSVYFLRLWVLKDNRPVCDTALTCEAPRISAGADWRLILAGRTPEDSLLAEMPEDSVTFMREFISRCSQNKKAEIIILIKSCEEASAYYAKLEEARETARLKAYMQFDSLTKVYEATGQMLGRGALVAFFSEGDSGQRLQFGDRVCIRWVLSTLGGTVLYHSPPSGDSLEVFDGSFIPGLHEALTGLRRGDTAMVYLPYFLGFGEDGQPPNVKPFENLRIGLRVLKRGSIHTEKRP